MKDVADDILQEVLNIVEFIADNILTLALSSACLLHNHKTRFTCDAMSKNVRGRGRLVRQWKE